MIFLVLGRSKVDTRWRNDNASLAKESARCTDCLSSKLDNIATKMNRNNNNNNRHANPVYGVNIPEVVINNQRARTNIVAAGCHGPEINAGERIVAAHLVNAINECEALKHQASIFGNTAGEVRAGEVRKHSVLHQRKLFQTRRF